MADSFLFSGEPLPLAPKIGDDVELDVFIRKLLDYIRRLGAKLSNPTFLPATAAQVRLFSGLLSADEVISTAWEALLWERFLRKDTDVFQHSITTNPDEITFLQDGFYTFLIDAGADGGSCVDCIGDVEIRVRETTLGVIDYSFALDDGNPETHSCQVGVNAAAGSVFTVEMRSPAADYTTVLERTRLNILFSPVGADTVYPDPDPGCTGPFDCFYETP